MTIPRRDSNSSESQGSGSSTHSRRHSVLTRILGRIISKNGRPKKQQQQHQQRKHSGHNNSVIMQSTAADSEPAKSEVSIRLEPAVEVVQRVKAATVIQRAWRYRHLQEPLNAWRQAKVSVARIKKMQFEDAARLMRSLATTRGSSILLNALLKHTPAAESAECKFPGRIFVAGYLFAAHPQGLITGSSHMDSVIESSAATMVRMYRQFEVSFVKREAAWFDKQQAAQDTQELLATMEQHYLELDRLWQSVQRRTNGAGDEGWRQGIKEQRDNLVDKIRMLGGSHAVERLMQRQDELRLTYADPQPSQTPSIMSDVINGSRDASGAGMIGQAASAATHQLHQKPTNTNACELEPEFPALSGVSVSHHHPSATLTRADVDRVLGHFDLSASAALQDARLAHELVLNPEMRLEPAGSNTLAGAVQRAIIKAFFDRIAQEIEAGKSGHVLQILMQLQRDLRTIVPPHGQLRESLDRELNTEWMGEQLRAGALDVRAKVQFALHLMRQVCAPVRDSAIAALATALDSLDLQDLSTHITRQILELIRDIRLDSLNYQLQTVVRPWLMRHAVEYERAKISQILGSQQAEEAAGLVSDWMRAAKEREGSGDCTADRPKQTAHHIFHESILDLCFAPTLADDKELPLTLQMDTGRIRAFQNEIQVVLAATALGILYGSLARQVPNASARLPELTKQWLGMLRSADISIAEIANAVHDALPASNSESVKRLVHKTLEVNDPVYKLMQQRLRRRINSSRDEVVGELARIGLKQVHNDAVKLLLQINALCWFNWQVCSPWYTRSV
ncbi:Tcp11-domain-containing protein [Linderina pennispora]|uniref:Tcp11-domain-containing protein n=1 Tax=Linderina pennispora TaxID=61395 RepID=A0A1Y1WFM6_9FUNG|nr:Tcp11-domain-containing protein [Linderina pennispora]ORX72323.1 Tcp11-domain-containing protein [Linderina pennispora]